VSGRSPDWSFWNWRLRADGNDKTFPVRPAIDWQTEGSDWSWVSKGHPLARTMLTERRRRFVNIGGVPRSIHYRVRFRTNSH
jgi:hypothetical protein